MEDLAVGVLSVYSVAFILLVTTFPLHGIYSIGTSLEIQQLTLFLVDGIDISDYVHWGTGVQFPAPAQVFTVAFFYILTRHIDVACAINNLVFSLSAVFAFRKLSGSRKLSFLLVFIPFWLCATFTSIPDMAGIFFIVLSLFLYSKKHYALATGLSAGSGLFRIENFGVSLIMLLHSKKWRHSPFLAVSGVAFLSWYQLVFGDLFLMLKEHSKVSIQPEFTAYSIMEAWNSGFYGMGKVVYTTTLLALSVATIVFARKRFGNNIHFLLASYLFLIHTVAFPVGIYFEYPRFFLMLAPITLITFKGEVERFFLPLCVALAILSFGMTSMFFSKAVWGQIA